MKLISKLRIIVISLCLMNMMSACESWLSVSPESEVKYDDLYMDKNGFKDQLTGIYTALCSEDLYGSHLTYGMIDALGQQYTWKLQAGNYYYLHRFEYENPTSVAIISGIWNKMYNTIANINILLKALEEKGSNLSLLEKDIYKGEALALRAYLHFDLLRIYGKSFASGEKELSIPYVKSISKSVTPFSTVADVLKMAVQDLEDAKVLLANDPILGKNANSDFLGNRAFHLNYYGVCALLARVELYMNDKVNALKNASIVIESGKYTWVTRDKITTPTREQRDGIFITEAIFTLNNTGIKKLVNKYLREGQSTDQYNVLISKPEVIDDIFESDLFGGFDWRYVYFFDQIGGTYKGNTKLWQFDLMPNEYKNRQPLLKLSEMYLIAAECSNDKQARITYLNTLRQHRGFDGSYNLEEDVDEKVFLQTIEKEYHKEFIGEGQWFFYCKRKDKEDLPYVSVPFSKKYYVLPIPQQEKEYGNR